MTGNQHAQREADDGYILPAENNSRLKSEFVNMMSHELRTPLTVILGYIPVLKNAQKLSAPELIAEIAGDMQTSGDHLLDLINDLLDISKIEAGKLALKPERLPLSAVAEPVVTTLQPKAAEKGIELTAEIGAGEVVADRVRLQQILINLVGNAVKFTDRGSVTITGRHLGDKAEFSVTDTGCGIGQQPDTFLKRAS